MSLDDSYKPVEPYERPQIVYKFVSASISGYLSPSTRMSPITGLQYLLEYPMFVLFMKTQFSI